MLKLDLEKAEEPEIKLPVFTGDHRKGKRIPEKKSTLLSTLKALTVWIITNCGKFLRDGNNGPPYLPPEITVCRSESNS